MNKITEFIKKHPMETGLIALIGGILFILLLRGRSSSSTAQSGPAQVAALTLQEQQLQAATGLQSQQVQAQQQAQQYSAQVANSQTAAALNAQNFQTEAALVADLSGNQTQLAGLNTQAGVINNQNFLQAQLANTYLGTQANLEGQYLTNEQSTINSVLGNVKNIGGSQNRLSLLLGALGEQQGSIAAIQGQTASSISSDNLLGNIGKSAGGVLTSLFG